MSRLMSVLRSMFQSVFGTRGLRLLPSPRALSESLGFLILGAGLLVGLAVYGFHPLDGFGFDGTSVQNVSGPAGAFVAAHLLHGIGVIGFVLPVVLVAWGALMVFGFVIPPSLRRLAGLAILAVTGAAMAQIQFVEWGYEALTFPFGGRVGTQLADPVQSLFGYGGSLIIFGVAGAIGLVLTGNIALSRTAVFVEDAFYWCRRLGAALGHKVQGLFGSKSGESPGVYRLAEAEGHSSAPVALVSPGSRTSKDRSPPKTAPKPKLSAAKNAHSKPDPSLFRGKDAGDPGKEDPDQGERIARMLTSQLAEFGVQGEVKGITRGPVISTIAFEPKNGIKVSKISALQDDLARLLKARSLRIIAPIPGKTEVGFEIPNEIRSTIGLAELFFDREFRSKKMQLPVAVGVDVYGKPVIEDLADMPHLLVAGSTGSGKSVFMNTLIASLIMRHSAKELRFVMIDPKMVELAPFNSLPHMACPVITDPAKEAKAVLDSLVEEMESRYEMLSAVGSKNVASFNEIIRKRRKSDFPRFKGKWQALPYIVLIIDEVADMMMTLGKEAEGPITRLAQKARAAGIHLVVATQRPSTDVITGLVKANFPTRVAFRVLSGVDSRTILDQMGAETLLGKGDMLYLTAGGMKRVHGAFVSEDEVQKAVKACA